MSTIGAIASNFYLELQKYTFTNKLLVTASGFAIGGATKEAIERLMTLVGLPFLTWIASKMTLGRFMSSMTGQVIWTMVVFLFTVVFSIVILEYFINRTLLGMKTVVDSSEFDKYIDSKAEAKAEAIIPLSAREVHQVKQKKEVEDSIVEQTAIAKQSMGVLGSLHVPSSYSPL